MMARGSFRAAQIEEAAFAQEPGRVSKIIETAQGFYIVKTVKRQLGGQLSFEKAQTQIEAELRRKQYEKLTQAYLAEIRAKATIVGMERFKKVAVNRAAQMYLRP